MPSVWAILVKGIDPAHVSLHHVHAAVSRWFDTHHGEHRATDKPYAISPLRSLQGDLAIEVRTLTQLADDRLVEHARPHCTVRLGQQRGHIGAVHRSRHESWDELAAWSGAGRWRLTFDTPVTFRSRNRATPLPDPTSIVSSLSRTWLAWSPVPLCEQPSLWVSDLSLSSEVVELVTSRHQGGQQTLTVPGSVGWMVLRAAGPAHAADRLLRLASYSGLGSFTLKGLGVTRTQPLGVVPRKATSAG